MIFTICVVLQMLLYYNYHTVIRKLEQQYYPQWSIFTHLRLTITINLCYGARMKTRIHKARIIDMKRYIIMFRIWFLQKINDASRQPSIRENSEKSIVSYSAISKKLPKYPYKIWWIKEYYNFIIRCFGSNILCTNKFILPWNSGSI